MHSIHVAECTIVQYNGGTAYGPSRFLAEGYEHQQGVYRPISMLQLDFLQDIDYRRRGYDHKSNSNNQ